MLNTTSFVHLRMHSEFSVTDGIVKIGDAIKAAKKIGMPALAMSDMLNTFGLIKFYKKARNEGIKPIAAADIKIDNLYAEGTGQLLLLVKHRSGFLQLCELLSQAWLKSSVNHTTVNPAWLNKTNCSGLIALSGGQQGEIGQLLLQNKIALAKKCVVHYQSIFGQDFYLELQRYGQADAEIYNQRVLKLAQVCGVAVVATHPIQFLHREDFRAHEARVCISQGEILANPRRTKRFTEEQYFKSTEEMQALFADLPIALENTISIAQKCNLVLELGKSKLPDFPTPEGMTLDDYLRHLSHEGLMKRLVECFPDEKIRAENQARYEARLKLECDTIIQMGFPGYFLIVQDFINWAKRNGVPVGPGRGSGAGSLVAYSLGITDLDPLPYDLLFERFLNPERVSMPDFDIDFCQDGRDRVIDYVKETYGRDAVSQIATFGTLGAKAVIRDCGRVLDMPYNYCDGLSKLIPHNPADPWDLERALKEEPVFKERIENEEEAREIIELAKPLEGLTRNIGMHAGGVLIAPGKLTDFCPLYCAPGTDSVVSQFDKDDVEAVGLVKFDFLGLRNLTIIDWAVRYIHQLKAEPADWNLTALNDFSDPAAYQLLCEAKTTAVFQLESRGMKELLKKLKPSVFEDIIAVLALFRPGPLGSGMVDDFINRKHGRAQADYFHPNLEPVLKPTYGVIVYQEQVMLISQVIGGYTLGGADLLRRAMGKKKAEEMAMHREIFVNGAKERGFEEQLATTLFNLMEKFAEYGFNKSHTAAYAVVAYQTAWLKAHHPSAFMAATLSADMNDTDKVKIAAEDAMEVCGLTLLPPDVNESFYRFVPVDAKSIRYGLGAIKGTGEAAIESIIDVRTKGGPFTSFIDFCSRIEKQKINRRVLEALIRAGAFDSIDKNRAQLLANVQLGLDLAEQTLAQQNQVGLFDDFAASAPKIELMAASEWSQAEALANEKLALGYYFSGHLFDAYATEIRKLVRKPLKDLMPSKDLQWLAGINTGIRTQMSKRGKMAFVTLDDGTKPLEVAIFNEVFEQYKHIIKEDNLLIMQAKISEDSYSGGMRVVVEKIFSLDQARTHFGGEINFYADQTLSSTQLRGFLEPFCANQASGKGCRIKIHYQNVNASCTLTLGDAWQIIPTDDFFKHVKQIFPNHRVTFNYQS